MLGLLNALPLERYNNRNYIIANTDITSEKKAKAAQIVPMNTKFYTIPRSREVGQSYIIAIWMTIYAFFVSLRLVYQLKPSLLLVNGPGTCLPVCLSIAVLRYLCLVKTKIIFVESVCRVKKLSMTGIILYKFRIADKIMVQWSELATKYPRTTYVGILL